MKRPAERSEASVDAELQTGEKARPTSPESVISETVPFFLVTLANRLTSSTARYYSRKFGLGIVEWRLLAGVAVIPNARPVDVVQMTCMDKGAIAKAIRSLEARGIISSAPGVGDARTKTLFLTAAGRDLYDAILPEALLIGQNFLSPLSARDRDELLRILKTLFSSFPRAGELEATGVANAS